MDKFCELLNRCDDSMIEVQIRMNPLDKKIDFCAQSCYGIYPKKAYNRTILYEKSIPDLATILDRSSEIILDDLTEGGMFDDQYIRR